MTSTRSRAYRTGQILGVPGGVCAVVLNGGDFAEDVTCAGERLLPQRPDPCSTPAPYSAGDVRPGDVLRDPLTGLELRCIRGGPGPLAHGGRPLEPGSCILLRLRRRFAEPTR